MQTFLHGRDFIGDLDFTKEEVETVLDVAFDLKRKRALNESHAYLRDKVLGMLFFFSSTRTRCSFEAGMAQLGGHAAFIESKTTQISHGDTAKEIGEILGRYFDGIAIRQCDWKVGNEYIRDVAKASRTPVLNMQCDIYHPFQCLADLMTIVEKKGRDLRKKKMVVSWAYAASYQKPMSVPQSLVLQMPRFGMDVTLAHPPEFKLMPEIMEQAQAEAKKAGVGFEVVDDMEAAFKDADIVYAKSWGAMCHTEDAEEGSKIIEKYESWITDERKMALAKPDAIYMHPLPADRNVEVTDGVMDGTQSVVYDEAENRMHAQKAVMALTM
ncbi:MAG: ornithine carbamoyltransferase [Deltaproteobacteria bacterium]|jgi:N-acetylornithine carbamoyltransferase|nr:ornithine carbamoyltransferase [Deltaproteobacteria bacterium]MBW2536194.1 ornithine carbamoyltransferase [Deltaproteobacteria bacterium]